MIARVVVTAWLAVSAATWAADTKVPDKKKSQPQTSESMTGCVDQRGETYVLAGPAMKQEAKLSGKAFSDDNFARYVGHTITVRGTVDRTVSPPVVDVTKIDEVSATCR